jgi:hypothetical protein
MAHALRFFSLPERGSVEVVVMDRLLSPTRQTGNIVTQVVGNLDDHLSSFELSHAPLPQVSQGEIPSKKLAHQLFNNLIAIVEIRQNEPLVLLMTVNREAYVIHHSWGVASACLRPIEASLRLPEPVFISIYLEPTLATSASYEALDEAIHIAQIMVEQRIKSFSDTGICRLRDSGVDSVGCTYSSYCKSLAKYFNVVAKLANQNVNADWNELRSLSGHTGSVISLVCLPDGDLLASNSVDSTVRL